VRRYVHERETEATRRIGELGKSAKLAEEFGRAFGEFQDIRLPQGVSQAAYVKALLAAERGLTQNPQKALQHLARHYGVDLRALAGDDGSAARLQDITGRHAQTESALRHALSELDRLRGELAKRDDADKQRRAEQERAVREAKRQVPINQSSSRGATPVRTTLDDTIRRQVSRVMGG
jgi:hypothetical protein